MTEPKNSQDYRHRPRQRRPKQASGLAFEHEVIKAWAPDPEAGYSPRDRRSLMAENMRLLATAAMEAGVPRDQLSNFLASYYVPQPMQLRVHAAAREVDSLPPELPTPIIAQGGTRGSMKTHTAYTQMALDDCVRAPELKCLFLRNVKAAAAESFEDLTLKILKNTRYRRRSNVFTLLDSGSRITVGGFKDDRDIDKYLGIEFDAIAVEEVPLLSQSKIEMLSGSCRSTRSDWKPRLYWTFNPSGIGYQYVKETVIEPWRTGTETYTRFFHSHWQDNRFLQPEYIASLELLTGFLRKIWYEGDLDVFAGRAFPTFALETHTCDPFPIPANWVVTVSVDWGYDKPFCAIWRATDPDTGRMYIIQEVYQPLLDDIQQAKLVNSMTKKEWMVGDIFADPSFWTTKVAGSKVTTTASEYIAMGVFVQKGDNHRLNGKRKVERSLGKLPDGLPGLMVFNTCKNTINELMHLVVQEGQEDVAPGQEDHCYDSLRYNLTRYSSPALRKERDPMVTVKVQEFMEAFNRYG